MTDPVRAQRRRIDRWASRIRRTGFLAFGASLALLVIGAATELGDTLAAVIIALVIVGSILLLPAIIVGYAVRAAERHDREHGR